MKRKKESEKENKYEKKAGKLPDPTPSKFRPDSNFGSVTETIDKMIEGKKRLPIFLPSSFAKWEYLSRFIFTEGFG